MNFQAIAWDVDGTLVDSEPLHHRALLAVCASYQLDLRQVPASRFCGVHIHDVWLALRPQLPPDLAEDQWLAAIEDYYQAHRHQLVPMPGSRATIAALARQGIRQACVSNSCRRIVETNLRALGVLEVMEFLITLDEVTHGKPAAEPYLRAVTQFGLAPHRVLAVEDSNTGVASARAAGLAVGVYGTSASLPPGAHPIQALSDIVALCDELR